MPSQNPVLFLVINFIIPGIILPVLVFLSARKFKKSGVKISPFSWAFVAFLFNILGVLLYLFSYFAIYNRQLKAIKENNEQKQKETVKTGRRIRIILFCLFFIVINIVFGLLAPLAVRLVRGSIKKGMTVEEVTKAYSIYRFLAGASHIRYEVRGLDAATQQVCKKTEALYEQCQGIDCPNQYWDYFNECERAWKSAGFDEFKRITENFASQKDNFAEYRAKVSVMFIGPGWFTYSNFEAEFDADGRVGLVTPIKMWGN